MTTGPLRADADDRAAQPPIARTLAGIAGATTVCVLPAFLLGSQAVQLRRDLDFDLTTLGVVIALSWLSASLASTPMGRLAERIGGGRALRAAALTSGAVQLLVAGVARSWAVLALATAVSGAANALAQPGANLLITRVVPPMRHGLAFAVKQAAIPFATLLGGLAVPLVTLTVGWRWTFVGGGVLAVLAAAAVPVALERRPDRPAAPRRSPHVLRAHVATLVVLAVGIGLGAAAAGGLAAFLTSGAVAAGVPEGRAGWLLSAGSAVGITMRLVMGARADRRSTEQLPVVAGMMAIGALAFGVLAVQAPITYLLATPVAFGAGWAWPGLFNLSVVRHHREAPAAATGITQTGTYLGAALGPLAFGAVVDDGSFGVAWLGAAASLALGAAILRTGQWLLDQRVATDGHRASSSPFPRSSSSRRVRARPR